MTSEVTQADRLIYVQWSDDGQHIRKWAREPFAGATAFANAGNGAPLGPGDASEHYPIKHLPFALRETAQNIYVECAPHVLEDMVRIITDAANVIEDRTAQSGEGDYTEAFDILVDVHDALALTAEYSDGAMVSSFVASSTQFARLRKFLHDRQYADPRSSGEGRSGAGEDAGPFHVSQSGDGKKLWFSARDPASGVTIPARDRTDARNLVSSLNHACATFAALNARQSGDDEEEKAYRIGKDEGYQDAMQEIDIATGGDGEFRFCLGGDTERHCPDAETMKDRILDRFNARQSGEGERFRPVEEWDARDETVLLLVDYSDGDHPLDDAVFAITIGHNNDHNVGDGEGVGWQFAGWCWSHDHYVEGKGKVVGWMPIPHHLAALRATDDAGGAK